MPIKQIRDLFEVLAPRSARKQRRDAHVYEPRPADAMALARADVILVNGLLLEGFMERLIEASCVSACKIDPISGVIGVQF